MQKHAARNLHYDLRLELDGVLKSWAVPKDPSYDQSVKRAAFMTEDHPIEYATFEGVIPKDNYGAGAVIVWDSGTWIPLEDPHAGFEKGKLLFELRGHRMRGRWTLIKVKRGENEWLLIKERDALEGPGRDTYSHDSILTGRTLEQLRDGDDVAATIRRSIEALPAKRPAPAVDEIEIMLAESSTRPFDDDGWVFELKYDGYRIIAGVEDGDVTLLSRNGNDMTATFPEIAEAVRQLPYRRFVIDGEVVVHDDAGMPSFQRLQKRGRLGRAVDVRRAALDLPATLYVFDLLAFEDHDLRPLPLIERKRILRMLLPSTGTLRYSDHVAGTGVAFHAAAERLDLEGIIGKRATAQYRGGRSKDWVKFRIERTDDFVVIGLKASKSAGEDYGSLHIAQYVRRGEEAGSGQAGNVEGATLVFAGSVGTGLTPRHVKELLARVTRRSSPAAEGVGKGKGDLWVEPTEVVEVRYLEWTEAGQLRHPVFLRWREDKAAEECVRRVEAEAEAEAEAGSGSGSGSSQGSLSTAVARSTSMSTSTAGSRSSRVMRAERSVRFGSRTWTRCCGRTTATRRVI
jgi:bifunctional non-homologous end joining protein LigD